MRLPTTLAHRKWRRLWPCLLLALACASALASPPRSLRFEHLGVEQGLAQESVLTILQDRQGFMWFGTQAGLSRFDGYKMTVYKNDPAEPGSIVDNYVISSCEDEQGRLWFGTRGGLVQLERASQKFISYPEIATRGPSAGNRAINAILRDGNGKLWLATSDGLRLFDPASGHFTALRHDAQDPASLGDDRVNALARDAHGNLWVGTNSGMERLAAGGSSFMHFPLDPQAPLDAKKASVLALSFGPDNTLWVGTSAGLEGWHVEGPEPQRRRYGAAEGMAPARILALYQDRDANLWVGTDVDGVKWRDTGSGRFVGFRHQLLDQHSLSDNQINAIHVDHAGTLWVGSWYGGLSRVDLASGGFERYAETPGNPDSLSSGRVRVIQGNGHGQLWLGTTGGGLDRLDPVSGKVEVWRHDAARAGTLRDDAITALQDAGARLWVGAVSGLAWMDTATGRFTNVSMGADPAGNYIQGFLRDSGGALWVLTRGGVFRFDSDGAAPRNWRHDGRNPASLADNWTFHMLEDRDKAIWIGTDNGLDRYDRASDSFTHFRHDPNNPASLRHNRVHYIYQSQRGDLWVGTAGGLNRMERGADGQVRFRYYALTHARVADPVGAILEDKAGMLWVSTTAGITRLDPATGQIKPYTSRDGLIDGSYFVASAYHAPDGRLYFGGLNGMTAFRPEAIHDNPHPPPVLITDFLIFNQPVRPGSAADGAPLTVPIQDAKTLTLSHHDSVFALEFSALHYADPARNRFAYQLEGFDQAWVETDASKRYATYTNLDPGHYVFRVKASNKDGVWNDSGATLEITILPPFWKTWWFRLLALALAGGSAYGLFRVRIRALVQQKQLLAEQVGARTAELVLEKEAVERQKESVELAHRNISKLSDIGREITAKLDSESIMQMLYGRVNELMDASVFGIGVYAPERGMIDYPFAIERGKRYAPYSRSMDEPNQLAVWCIVHEQEVFINDLDAEYRQYIDNLDLTSSDEHMGTLDDGSKPQAPRSLLYVPISVNGRMLGVVTVHSYRAHAYERIDLDMLRTLAAYVGVAFDNANAYRQLKDTQQQLVAQEKLAALGSLVAGVAHELNTPIGNSLLMASALQQRTEEVAAKFDGTAIRRSDLAAFIGSAQEASGLIMRSLMSAADLVNSFKQVAVDQASAQRRRFNLEQASQEIVATMMNQVRKAGHVLELDIPSDIAMDSFPGPFGQVIINFINNALLHAFEKGQAGRMLLSATRLPDDRVQVEFHDNGVGIAPEHLARIFDPFFTTKMGQGGSGLGLNITYNIVTSLLKGHIRVTSAPGEGTTFIMDLPTVVAGAAQEKDLE
ncbi:MAG: two-component regulator propeller domain-containing protein [Pseudomonadota bacterium]